MGAQNNGALIDLRPKILRLERQLDGRCEATHTVGNITGLASIRRRLDRMADPETCLTTWNESTDCRLSHSWAASNTLA